MPCRASRSQSAWVKMPLSETSSRSAGTSAASRSDVSSAVAKLRRSRLLMPISFERQLQRPLQLVLVMHFDQHIHAELERGVFERARLVVGKAGHDDQDGVGAPGARLVDLVGLEHEILAQRRQCRGVARRRQIFRRALERRARRSAPRGTPHRLPHRRGPSAGGSKSARIKPLDGLAFLISAISANSPPARLASSAATKPRGGAASRARALISAGGTRDFAAAISWRL